VVVSEVGSYAELPDDACLKTPVDEREVETIFEYLNLLVSRPEAARGMGERARAYVASECSWERVASQYAEFLEAVVQGREWTAVRRAAAAEPPTATPPEAAVAQAAAGVPHPWAEYILGYASGSPEQLGYARKHLTRLVRTLEITPRGAAGDRILEMGAYLHITPALKNLLGYGEVRGSYLGPAGRVDHRRARSSSGEEFCCEIDLFNAEKDRFPYPDGHFATVLCCELLEHLAEDPMHMMAEVSRILRAEGTLVLTTPNICGLRAIDAILQGYHPGLFHQYIRPAPDGEVEPRHHREYAPRDVAVLFEAAGFEVTLLETGPFLAEPSAGQEWVVHLIDRYGLPAELRGEGIFALGRKVSAVKRRYPAALYAEGAG
jgi:SAM-dependent methyltransferase